MIEASLCLKQLRTTGIDGWALGIITPLPGDYWEDQDHRVYLLNTLLAVSVLGTFLQPDHSLPIETWWNETRLRNVIGSEVDRFFSLLDGTQIQTDRSLLEEAALALRRIREETLLPNDLFICHFRLLNSLCSGEWGNYVGDALAETVAAQWLTASENQRFALTSPALYAALLEERCEDTSRSGSSKVASILKTAAVAAGVRLDSSGIEFLTHVELGESITSFSTCST
jgi:hypothetical protein